MKLTAIVETKENGLGGGAITGSFCLRSRLSQGLVLDWTLKAARTETSRQYISSGDLWRPSFYGILWLDPHHSKLAVAALALVLVVAVLMQF